MESITHLSFFAHEAPDRVAVVVEPAGRQLTYGQLEERTNRVAQLLRSFGLREGDNVALVLENRAEFFEVEEGALRMGLYVTPINWHLAPEEAAYIVEDCGASVLFASSELVAICDRLRDGGTATRRFAIGGSVEGFDDYEAAIAAVPGTPVDEQSEGAFMFYSSGTTGRPKGIKPPSVGGPLGGTTSFSMLVSGLYAFGAGKVYLSPAPLYHAAPAGWTDAVLRLGGTAVVMDRFDPIETLRLIEKHRVTHVQFVPTHLVRMLKLPEDERAKFDLSSLEVVVHAAAPCPPEVKRATLEWLGPIVHEYYSGSEGSGFCAIGPDEWLAHPGSVGKSLLGPVHVTDPLGEELPAGEVGQLWFESGRTFEYHGDPDKTAEAVNAKGWSSFGDMGYVDDDGYVFLTDRVTNMIISGGVNIYPREIEDVLILHPAVADVAVIGVADAEMGEQVRALVQVADDAPLDTDALPSELIAFARERLSSFKCPRSVILVDELPRLPTGKLAKRLLPETATAP